MLKLKLYPWCYSKYSTTTYPIPRILCDCLQRSLV